eukprot:6987651-Prorocentrum_lima.AAC.1
MFAQTLESEEHKQTLFQLIEERRKSDADGESGMTLKEIKLLKQDITQLKDNLASDMTMLESRIQMERRLKGD